VDFAVRASATRELAAAARRKHFGRTRFQTCRTSFGSLADAMRKPKIVASRLGHMQRKT
jgi:hypothetical protein